MEENLKIKPMDVKLLAYLYYDSRAPLTKIAKELHLSREQVEYRIKKFEENGVIRGNIPIVNYSRLGYHHTVIFLVKFNRFSKVEDFKKNYMKDKLRILSVELLGKYDLGMIFIFKNEQERNEHIFGILQDSVEIVDYNIVEPFMTELYPLKFLGDKKFKSHLTMDYKKEPIKLDEKDIKLLKVLRKDAKARVIDIAHEVGISAELVVYKLKRLKEGGVWLGARAYFDMDKLGFFYTLLFLNFTNFSSKIQSKLRSFVSSSKHTETLSFMLGRPNAYLQLFHKDEEGLRETIRDLKELMKEESFSIDVIPLKNEGEDINVIPFL